MIYGLDLFSGIGGMALGLHEFIKPIAYCEINQFCQAVLLQNMQRGLLPIAPVYDDIKTFPIESCKEVDIITAGFPCQDISIAGIGVGLEGKRSSLFFELLKFIESTDKKPKFIFLENVPAIRSRGAERVCKELAKRGYDSRWFTNTAREFGAPHKRERWWLLANSTSERFTKRTIKGLQSKSEKSIESIISNLCSATPENPWEIESPICGMDDGVPNRLDRIKALGNSVVPIQTRQAFIKLLTLHVKS